jgi:putative CocE/NonD family hydrolase
LLGATAAALLGVPAAQADVTVTESPVQIPASMPADSGAPVTLDGGIDVPSAGCPCPGVILNHGFLGNWHNSGGLARELAAHGYVVLRYSSRGFGNTPGEVDLMGPKERQDLLDAVHWLNARGDVVHNDIGQYGASYGGAHAWWLAQSGDPAVRTVIPTATWTDIYDALMPNDVELLFYVNGFYATGLTPVAAAQESELSTDDNYSQEMHRWIAEANSGLNTEDLEVGLDSRSMTGRYGDVHIPVFIVQGTNDGLFSQNQALDAYRALADHVPTRLYVGGVGHPPSDSDENSPEARHIGAEALAWFDHWLKGVDNGIDRMPPIEYSHAKYFDNTWDGKTVSADHYPFGPAHRMYLCAGTPRGGTLADAPCPSAVPAAVTNSAGAGVDEEPYSGGYAIELHQGLQDNTGQDFDLSQVPPTLSFDGPALTKPLDLVGIPRFHYEVASASVLPAGLKGGAAAYQLDPKLYDVDADGKASIITRGAWSEQLNAQQPTELGQHGVDFEAFGLSYTLPAGHHLRITLSTSDAPYLRPTPNPFAAVLFAGSSVELPSGADMVPTPPFEP